jgi:anti-sigma B factor antagonist
MIDREDEFRISISNVDDLSVVTLRGDWDLYCRDRLHEALLAVGSSRDVVVDLRVATFFDSSALGELIAFYKRMTEAGRRVEVLVGSSNMQRLLDLTSLSGLLGATRERTVYLEERLRTDATPSKKQNADPAPR